MSQAFGWLYVRDSKITTKCQRIIIWREREREIELQCRTQNYNRNMEREKEKEKERKNDELREGYGENGTISTLNFHRQGWQETGRIKPFTQRWREDPLFIGHEESVKPAKLNKK